jgi:UDP:flavonoid glycosyltransferase YjiC (YdhE family)
MRLLFAAVGAHGHLIPLLPLAEAARDAGHEVTVATAEPLHDTVRQAGLEPVAAGATAREAITQAYAQLRPDQPRSEVSAQAFGSTLPQRAAADLGPILAARKPDLIVYEALNPGAAIAAALAQIPAFCHGLGRVADGPIWQAMCAAWTATAARAGVEAAAADPRFFGNPYLDICPPSLQSGRLETPAGHFLLRPEPWCQEAVTLPPVVHGPERGRPLVYLTSGTAFNDDELLRQAIAGLSALPVDVLVVTGATSSVQLDQQDLPPNVTLERWVPQGNLLPHIDLAVSHGGSGTMLNCLAKAVPHLLLPQGADQFGNAQAVCAAGAGRQILPGDLTAEAITRAARELLADDDVRENARRLSAEIAAMPSPHEVIEQLTR